MLKIGLTGGIGAGKSTVAKLFTEHGVPVIDADVLAREVVQPGSPVLAELKEKFGPSIFTPEGELDRGRLASVAFASSQATADLGAIMHPAISSRTAELYQQYASEPIVVNDVPLLVENGLSSQYHLVVLVHAGVDVRKQRLIDTRGMLAEDVDHRIRSQASDADRFAVVDVVLDNNGTEEALIASFEELCEHRIAPFAQALKNGSRGVPPAPESWSLSDERVRAHAPARIALRIEKQVRHAGGEARVTWAEDFNDGAPIEFYVHTTLPKAAQAGLVAAGFVREGDTFVYADPGQPAGAQVVCE